MPHDTFCNVACMCALVTDESQGCCQEDAREGRDQVAGNSGTDATAALKPFLHEHAAHFWHELK